MDRVCFVFPILPGKTDGVRKFLAEMNTHRRTEYERSQRRIHVTAEDWYLASLPSGDHLIVFVESADFARALAMLALSNDDFDRWYNQSLIDLVGADINNPPEITMPELLLSHAE